MDTIRRIACMPPEQAASRHTIACIPPEQTAVPSHHRLYPSGADGRHSHHHLYPSGADGHHSYHRLYIPLRQTVAIHTIAPVSLRGSSYVSACRGRSYTYHLPNVSPLSIRELTMASNHHASRQTATAHHTRLTLPRTAHGRAAHTPTLRTQAARLVAGLIAAGSTAAWAAGPSVDLEASASQRVPNDEMRVQLVKESSGKNLETLNTQVIEAINAALDKAKGNPGVRAWASGINTSPEWTQNGKRDGWQVRGNLTLEGTDTAAVARLAGQLASSLQLDGVTYQLSTPRRRAEENRLIKEAVDAFRARAAATAEAFGYKSYEIKQIKLGTSHHSEGNNDGVVAFAAAPRMARDEGSMPSLADQGGDTTITLTASGTIELR